MGFIDCEKAFDSFEHFVLSQINSNEDCIQISENIYRNAAAPKKKKKKLNSKIDNLMSKTFQINLSVRCGDSISLDFLYLAISSALPIT